MFKSIFLTFVILLLATAFAFSQDDENYASIGIGLQANRLKNAYESGGNNFANDFSVGYNVSLLWEQYGEGTWMKSDFTGLLMGGLAAVGVMRKPGLRLSEYEDRKMAGSRSYYLFNDKFLHWQTAWAPGDQTLLGPTLQFGFESVFVVEADANGKGKTVDRALGGGEGLLSMGTGLNIFEPFENLADHSRLTISRDWFLKRNAEDKFGFGGRGRWTVEASAIVNKRFTLRAYFQYFNFKGSYFYTDNTTGVRTAANSKLTTFGVAASFNWLYW